MATPTNIGAVAPAGGDLSANFRDLGGYSTRQGQRVRKGMVFRSSVLPKQLSESDQKTIQRLHIRCVCDLRTRAEVARHPTDWSKSNVRLLESDKPDTKAMLAQMFALGDAPEAAWRKGWAELYATFPEIYAEEYATLFAALAEGEVPMLINCSAGKDRTGVACAMVLLALDVPMEQAIEDYLKTAERLREDRNLFAKMLAQDVVEGFDQLPSYAKALMSGVDESAFRAAFNGIDARYGSFSVYLEQRLGITPVKLKQLRSHMLEAVN